MKRFLLSLLVFVMLTPGLACAQFMHGQKQHTSMVGMVKKMPCCPKSECPGTKLFKDCAKIDLQHATDVPLLKKAEITKILPYILPQDHLAGNLVASRGLLIHGPPDPPEIFRSYPPVFLATQRLRI